MLGKIRGLKLTSWKRPRPEAALSLRSHQNELLPFERGFDLSLDLSEAQAPDMNRFFPGS
jgi:hypothetical protein